MLLDGKATAIARDPVDGYSLPSSAELKLVSFQSIPALREHPAEDRSGLQPDEQAHHNQQTHTPLNGEPE
jgi:hypothetical protein